MNARHLCAAVSVALAIGPSACGSSGGSDGQKIPSAAAQEQQVKQYLSRMYGTDTASNLQRVATAIRREQKATRDGASDATKRAATQRVIDAFLHQQGHRFTETEFLVEDFVSTFTPVSPATRQAGINALRTYVDSLAADGHVKPGTTAETLRRIKRTMGLTPSA